MNAKFELEVLEQNSNEVIEAFKIEGGAQALFDRIASQARSIVPDLSTDKGRKAIASVARKVATTKTAFDAHGKALKEQYTVITNKIDADRKLFRDQCDALRDEVRQPLTDWEQAEKDRVAKHENSILVIKEHLQELDSLNAERIANRIEHLENFDVDYTFEEYEDQAKLAKFETLETLRKALAEREKYEAEQAELEAKRQAEALRQQQERDAQIAREATEKAQREAEEKARFEAEKAQREKLEAEQREARLLAEKEAAVLREEAAVLREEALKQKAIDDAKQAEIDKQQAVEAERMRIEIQKADLAEAERKAEEARKADVEHRRWINNEALIAFKSNGVDEAIAKQVIAAIAKNQIPHISIKY